MHFVSKAGAHLSVQHWTGFKLFSTEIQRGEEYEKNPI